VRLAIPKPKLPFRFKTQPQEVVIIEEDPLVRELTEFSKKLLGETHEANMRVLMQTLEEIRYGHHKRES
jgi:hypothetical protein